MNTQPLNKIKIGSFINTSMDENDPIQLALVHNTIFKDGKVIGFHVFPISSYEDPFKPPEGSDAVKLPKSGNDKFPLLPGFTYYIERKRSDFLTAQAELLVYEPTDKRHFINDFLSARDKEILSAIQRQRDAQKIIVPTDLLPTHVKKARQPKNGSLRDIEIDKLVNIPELQLSENTKVFLESLGIKRLRTAYSLVTAKGDDYARLKNIFEQTSQPQDLSTFRDEVRTIWSKFLPLTMEANEYFSAQDINFTEEEKKPKLPKAPEPNISIADASSEGLSYFEDERTSDALQELEITTLREAYVHASTNTKLLKESLEDAGYNKRAQNDIIADIICTWELFEENVKTQPEDFPTNIRIFQPV
ncbi:MAG: hypothetical protein A3B66_06140 [Alphaproteobacteria bacterium RIFCSPHIGHO2_02_FULL_46_13]|nr:MAG: hypothetical protein A3B66_06140 [Alphaproteobacteria bacterium RIFCSPHIGHO2_02_FULL_46_13]